MIASYLSNLYSLHNDARYGEFIHWFNHGVPEERFCMGLETKIGELERVNLATWMRRFSDSKQDLATIPRDPCSFLGFGEDKEHTFYKLVMGQGDDYAIDLFLFDQLPDRTRKVVAVNTLCGVSCCGSVPWHSSLREELSHVDTEKMMLWRR